MSEKNRDNKLSHSRKDEDHEKRIDKRKKEEKTFTIVTVILYSIFLVFIVVASYVGVKLFITSQKEKRALEAEKQQAQLSMMSEENLNNSDDSIEEDEEEIPEEEPVIEEESGEWKDLVFSKLENPRNSSKALINTYNFTRMRDINDGGHTMYYNVYSSNETGDVEKITTTENCGDLYEIIDYYYLDGKINYIAQYSEVIDVPINISATDIQSRYYFNNDKLVRYIYCENEKATEYSLEDLDSYSDGTVSQYNYLENMMLDKAKFTWENINELNEVVTIKGYVLDEYNYPLVGAKVELVESASGESVVVAETDGDGKYSIDIEANDASEYDLKFSAKTLSDTFYYGLKANKGSKVVDVLPIYLAYEKNVTPYQTQIFVKDADDSSINLTDADIKFREGLNCKTGETFLAGNLGEYGYISGQLRSGNYTCEVNKDGYETLYFNFNVKSDHLALVAFAVKDIKEGEIKAVLNWEANPLDLNIRCITSNGEDVFRSPVDSVGSTNAEIIDILNAGTDAYHFYVSDFTNIAISNYIAYSMSQCYANLTLYDSTGFVGSYPVPAGHAGVVWKPIEIRNGKVIITNDYYSSLDDNSIFMKK